LQELINHNILYIRLWLINFYNYNHLQLLTIIILTITYNLNYVYAIIEWALATNHIIEIKSSTRITQLLGEEEEDISYY